MTINLFASLTTRFVIPAKAGIQCAAGIILSSFFILHSSLFANTYAAPARYFYVEDVEMAINTFIAPTYRWPAARAYEANMDARGYISVAGLYRVCAAAGWDYTQTWGVQKCYGFLEVLERYNHDRLKRNAPKNYLPNGIGVPQTPPPTSTPPPSPAPAPTPVPVAFPPNGATEYLESDGWCYYQGKWMHRSGTEIPGFDSGGWANYGGKAKPAGWFCGTNQFCRRPDWLCSSGKCRPPVPGAAAKPAATTAAATTAPKQTTTTAQTSTPPARKMVRAATEYSKGPKNHVVYVAADGTKYMRQNGSASWRTNNPGNIVWSQHAKEMGAIGYFDSGNGYKFAIFPDKETGMRAIMNLWRRPDRDYIHGTLDQGVRNYAPPPDNNTALYQKKVREALGVPGHTPVRNLNDRQLEILINTIAKHEGWSEGKEVKLG